MSATSISRSCRRTGRDIGSNLVLRLYGRRYIYSRTRRGVGTHNNRRSESANATGKKGSASHLLSTMFPSATAGHHQHPLRRRIPHSVTSMRFLIERGRSPLGSQPELLIHWANCSIQDTCYPCSSHPTRECLVRSPLTGRRRTKRNTIAIA